MSDKQAVTEVEHIIEQVINLAKKKCVPRHLQQFQDYIRLFYSKVAIEDLEERQLNDLYGAALSQWQFIQTRTPQETKIQIFNPDFEADGWQSTHTVVHVVTEDKPFLVDTIRMEMNRLGFTQQLIIHMGGVCTKRDNNNHLQSLTPYHLTTSSDGVDEAHVYIEINRQTDKAILVELKDQLLRVLADVDVAVEDWLKMKQEMFRAIEEIEQSAMSIPESEKEESIAFLRWLANDNFTFLGCRNYQFEGKGEEGALKIIPGTGLGVLRDYSKSKAERYYSELPPEARQLALSKHLLIISKTNTRSTVHRPSYTDYIGVKRFDKEGNILGERRFIGLYTSSAYNSNPKAIPIVRKKVEKVLKTSSLPRTGHAAKALLNILETLPRDDVLQATTAELSKLSMGIFLMQERRNIRLFLRKDAYGRFISCLVYVPRENFTTELLLKMLDILQEAFNGTETEYTTMFSESVLARIHYLIRIDPKKPPEFDQKTLERRLIEVGKSWYDGLKESLLEFYGEERGYQLANIYQNAFQAGYREEFTPQSAVYDIEHIEKLHDEHQLGMSFYRRLDSPVKMIQFKLYRPVHTAPLSDALPMLENMGLRVIGEQPYEITFKDKKVVWINDFNMEYSKAANVNVETNKEIFQEAFYHVWHGQAESDGFNHLVLGAQLNWHEISMLRAYAKYLRQIGFTFSQTYITETFTNNPGIAKLLVDLFHCRFNPELPRSAEAEQKLVLQIEAELELVANLDEDRILRRYLDVLQATVRTNYYQKNNGKAKAYISFKFMPKLIPDMPLPLPMYEIFVYSPRFEGIHLRAAKTARGGLRWSDRREDFRTEVLGLMKAQQVKNAVIVPSGAKGGFVPKCLPDGNREEVISEAISCYKDFIRGLLDITDNLQASNVIKPRDVYCYDDEDPYLVVAADKGTATFSDIANSIAQEYGFWLGDAFASGGSAGYDHKKMGITARGAWESVKYHFQELGKDIQSEEFTVVGIGDMAGDVFGNGMLLSKHICLIAAFNHQHIFIDPNPEPRKSYNERQRLAKLPRSTWEDYDAKKISAGGGVFKRSAKSIRLTQEIKDCFGIKKDKMIPNDLIREILSAEYDLLWNGGIGTFVKASTETNLHVGDRSNDDIRVDANQLKVKVIGEGGNLGCTQLARVEYSLNGGKVNTDFIDNSGGVDCSDSEVNIKILLNEVVNNGDITLKQRNELLTEMTDEVAQMVLENNYRQVRTLSLAVKHSHAYLNMYIRFIRDKEEEGRINRAIEFLPDDKTLLDRKANNLGITTPEMAVLLAYSKIILKQDILASELPEDDYLKNFVICSFPQVLRERYQSFMYSHRLSREIIATHLSNMIVTDMGVGFVYQIKNEIRAPIADIVKAFVISHSVFKAEMFHSGLKRLDYKVDVDILQKMSTRVIQLMRRSTRWFLRNQPANLDIEKSIERFSEHVDVVRNNITKFSKGVELHKFERRFNKYIEAKAPRQLATYVASAHMLYETLNIVEVAIEHQTDVIHVAEVYFTLSERLQIDHFRDLIDEYMVENRWTVMARSAYKGDLDWIQRCLTIGVLKFRSKYKLVGKRVEEWLTNHQDIVERWNAVLADLKSSDIIEFAMLTVAIRELLDLSQASLYLQDGIAKEVVSPL